MIACDPYRGVKFGPKQSAVVSSYGDTSERSVPASLLADNNAIERLGQLLNEAENAANELSNGHGESANCTCHLIAKRQAGR